MPFTRQLAGGRSDVSNSILNIGSSLTFLYPRRALQTATKLFEAERQKQKRSPDFREPRQRQSDGRTRNAKRVGRRGQGDYQDHTGYYSDPLNASEDNIFASLRRDMRTLEARRNQEADGEDTPNDNDSGQILPPESADLESSAPFTRNIKGRKSESTMTAPEYQAFNKLLRQLEPNPTNAALDEETRFNLDDSKPLEERLDSIFEKASQIQEERALSYHAPGLLTAKKEDNTSLQKFPVNVVSNAPKLRSQLNDPDELRYPFPVALRKKYGKVRDTLEHQALVAQTHEKLAKERAAQEAEALSESMAAGQDAQQKSIYKARKQELEGFFKNMREAKTDTDIWRMLQSRTFDQMQALNKLMAAEKQALKSDVKVLGPLSKVNTIAAVKHTSGEEATQTLETDQKAMPAATESGSQPSSTNIPPKSQTDLNVTASLKKFNHPNGVHPLAVLQVSYATQLLTALRSLRKMFPQSPYILAILPEIKRLGPVSYVLGASTDFYNELLYVNWTQYRNLHSCADLLKDMMDCGIETNSITWAIWKDALAWRNHALRQLDAMESGEIPKNPVAGALIDLEGVADGFRRFYSITKALKKRIKADKEFIFEQSGAREELAEMEAALVGESNMWQAHLLDDMDGRKRVNKMIAERTIPLPEISDGDMVERAGLPEPVQDQLRSEPTNETDVSSLNEENAIGEDELSTVQQRGREREREREPVPVFLRAAHS